MKTITLVAHRRPEYLKQVIESLCANDTRGWSLVAALDFDESTGDFNKECANLLNGIDFLPKHVDKLCSRLFGEPKSFGINHANKWAYRCAINMGSTLNLALEDDTPLTPDCLDMVNWFEKQMKLDEKWVLNCFSHSKDKSEPSVIERAEFCPWGWATNMVTMKVLLDNWMCNNSGWGHSCLETCRRLDVPTFAPILSRTRNIGKHGGVHYTPELYDEHFSGHVMSDGTCLDYRII